MLSEPLPSTLDVRKAAARGVTVSGMLSPSQLPRFRALLAGDEGAIEAKLEFSRDEESRFLVGVKTGAEVSVICQRCLEPMQRTLSCENTLAIVWSDDEARALPRYLDPLIVPEEGCNLWELVEDELILSLPAFSYHDTEECRKLLADFAGDAPEVQEEGARPNPFEVLATLKSGDEH